MRTACQWVDQRLFGRCSFLVLLKGLGQAISAGSHCAMDSSNFAAGARIKPPRILWVIVEVMQTATGSSSGGKSWPGHYRIEATLRKMDLQYRKGNWFRFYWRMAASALELWCIQPKKRLWVRLLLLLVLLWNITKMHLSQSLIDWLYRFPFCKLRNRSKTFACTVLYNKVVSTFTAYICRSGPATTTKTRMRWGFRPARKSLDGSRSFLLLSHNRGFPK